MTRSTLAPLALLLLTMALAFALSIGFLGHIHPAFDSVGHFRLHLAAMLGATGAAMLFTRFRREGVFALVLGLSAVAATHGTPVNKVFAAKAQAETNVANRPVYRLLQFNGRFDNQTPEAFLSLVGRTRPDVITLQEVSAMWRERLSPLKTAYPHQIICTGTGGVGGVAILSRRPFLEGTEPGCLDDGMFALATLDLGGEAMQVATVHLHWPWPYQQPQQVARLSTALSGLADAAILAGDFNATRWSHTVRSMAAYASMHDAGPDGATWLSPRLPHDLLPWIGLGIDHVLAGRAIIGEEAKRLENAGSDHRPVLFEFSLRQAEPAPRRTTDMVTRSGAARPNS